VSGSCWAINTYLTYGERSIEQMIKHYKARLGTSFADPKAALPLFMERPTNKYLLRGLVERFKQGYTELGTVDIYGTLVASRILVPANELAVRDDWLKLSNQRKYIDDGTEPLPIYTAVRHEIPVKVLDKDTKKEEPKKNAQGLDDLGSTGDDGLIQSATLEGEKKQHLAQKAREGTWFQWFELTPYVLNMLKLIIDIMLAARNLKRGFRPLDWEDSIGMESMSIGRRNSNYLLSLGDCFLSDVSNSRIVGSAFCATLSHYYAEIRPFLPTSYALFRSLDELMKEVLFFVVLLTNRKIQI
jgi:cytosolic phospholipase A2